MYSAVRTHDYDYPESEMDDRESLYFDTISLADSEAAAAVVAARRKSISQSRNTIYHSAVDLAGDETPSKRSSMRLSENGRNSKPMWQPPPNYRHSSALDHYNGGRNGAGGDYTDAAIAAQVLALQNGHGGGVGGGLGVGVGVGGGIIGSSPYLSSDEVSRRLLQSSTHSSKDKKLPITYSQWKFRAGRTALPKGESPLHGCFSIADQMGNFLERLLNLEDIKLDDFATRRRFQDGTLSVDFVLAYKGDDHQLEHIKKREIFEANLRKEGLNLERDNTQHIHFIKLHAPLSVLCKYAEILKIKLPMKKISGQDLIKDESSIYKWILTGVCGGIYKWIRLDPEKFPARPKRIYFEFSRIYQHLFDWENPNFFDAGTRNLIINFILERQRFIEGEETPENMGIEKLLNDGVYTSAYTLHDDTDRDLLLSEWANLSKWKHLQPLDSIKEYFGPKVALYFAWLGFYTSMLIPLSIFGILCFIYGFLTWNSDVISQEICNNNTMVLMCPQCDRNCDYWELKDTCKSAKMNYLIDNNLTVVFACAMAIWAVLYLELWKRYSAVLIDRWGLTGYSHIVEHPRPQYLAKIYNNKCIAPEKLGESHSVLDPDVPFWRMKFLPNFTSYGIMVLFICISLIAIISLIIYRMAQHAAHSILGNDDSMTHKILVLPLSAGILDLIVISCLDLVYSNLAVHLTNFEYRRTQTEYDESLTTKNYIFQFVNYYSSLFYIAFLKGKFVGYPAKYNRIFGFRQEECNPGGCLMELCVQLVIIMMGKQAVNALVETLIPYLTRLFRKYSMRVGMRKRGSDEKLISCNQWTEDYHLVPWTSNSMYTEYLEMVLQYGFITLFSLAFPLAPLLALINNVFEVRLDSIKMLKYLRRPVAQRARSIGVWYNMMVIVTKIAVASNAMIIAFSTNLIPKLVYRTATQDHNLVGYLNFTLAYFNTKDFQVEPVLAGSSYGDVTSCRYSEFRNPPEHEQPYKRPMIYWKILTARLAFIVIFQNVVSGIQAILAWAVPDVPGKLQKRIKRENFLLREHIIEYEKKTAVEKAAAQKAIDGVQDDYDEELHDVMATHSEPETVILRQRHDNDPSANPYTNTDRTTPV